MTTNLDQFDRELDQLLGLRPGRVTAADPALQTATILLALELEAESMPPAELRARWVSHTQISARSERRTFMQSLRTRPAIALLFAILALLLLTGVVYAIGKSLGYIPGYGVMDQNIQMLMLAEPVSQTRDGITITIEEIILTSDKMYSTITTENIPNNLILPMSDTTTVTCKGDWVYQLPNGSQLSFEQGSGRGNMEPFASSDTSRASYRGRGYAKLSTPINLAEITDITLHIPCVTSDIPAGSLPENWEFHLHFVPAPAGMMERLATPVVEYIPSPIPTEAAKTPEANPISVTKVIEIGDSYFLMGEFIPPSGMVLSNRCCNVRYFDGNGQEFVGNWPMDIDFDPGTPTANTPFAFTWGTKIDKKNVILPVTVKVEDLHWKSFSVPFEFDAGDNPQPGDEWQVNHPFDVGGTTVTLETIRVINPQMPSAVGGYDFYFTYPSYDTMIAIRSIGIEGSSPTNWGFSAGGGCSRCPVGTPLPGMGYGMDFTSLPKNRLNIRFTFDVADGEQAWALQWQP